MWTVISPAPVDIDPGVITVWVRLTYALFHGKLDIIQYFFPTFLIRTIVASSQ